MSTHCVVCKHSSQCYKCQIKDLKSTIEKLTYELSYLRKGSNSLLVLKDDYSKHFETDNKFLPINYYGEMSDYQFLTITFDPQKFGLFNQPKDEQNYIFKYLTKSINKGFIKQLTGCFEYQKNGTTHAHIIIHTNYKPKEIEDHFRPSFTDDLKNRYAIKCYPLQKEKCEAYLQKESTEYYRYDLSFDDMPEAGIFADCKSKCTATLKQIAQILEQYKKEQEINYKKFEKDIRKRYNIPTNEAITI